MIEDVAVVVVVVFLKKDRWSRYVILINNIYTYIWDTNE